MATFQEFQTEFFGIFSNSNFYEGKSYLEYMGESQTNDEDNIVDAKIILPLLAILGFESGDIAKNTTADGKDNTRPDFQVKLASGNIRCFLVEDKHTAYDLRKPQPLLQLMSYAASRGYDLGLICNGKLLLGWDLSYQSFPNPILRLNIQEIVEAYRRGGLEELTAQQRQDLKSLYRRFHRQNFDNIETLIQEISRPKNEWSSLARNLENAPDFDELLIADLKAAINLLEEDVLYQLNLLLEEYSQYEQAQYLPNGNGSSSDINDRDTKEVDATPKVLLKIRKQILNYVRVYGVLEVSDFTWIDEQISQFAEAPTGSIQVLEEKILTKLIQAEEKKNAQKKDSQNQKDNLGSPGISQKIVF